MTLITPIVRKQFRLAQSTRGTSLIEVLVVMVIFAVGILGVAALQIVGLTSNSAATNRSQATILAYDMFEAMRSNRIAASKGEYAVAPGAAIPTGASIAQQDLSRWLTEVAARLPSGTAVVSNPAFELGDTGPVTVTVSWDESRAKKSSTVSMTNFAISGRL
jgi:type IV pilus assembly protein PilV